MLFIFFFKQKTAYEMRISDWSSDVCSSDLQPRHRLDDGVAGHDRDAPLLRRALDAGEAGLRPEIDDRAHLDSGIGQIERHAVAVGIEIGRASCRERVWKYV